MSTESARRSEEARRLQALDESGLMDAPPLDSLQRYTRIAREALGAPVVLVSLVDDRRQFFANHTGLDEHWSQRRETPLDASFCNIVVRNHDELLIDDAASDPRVADLVRLPGLEVGAYAGMPIRTEDDHVLGSFCAIAPESRSWSERDQRLLRDLSICVSTEVDLRRRMARSVDSERLLSSLNARLSAERTESRTAARAAVHDLRTPLGVLLLGLAHLSDHEGLADLPEIAKLLPKLERNLQHATDMVASLESRTRTVGSRAEGTDVDVLVYQTVEDLKPMVPGLEVSGLTGERTRLEATGLRRCVENVLTNAARFARSRVQVELIAEGGQVSITIDDDGPGLPDPEARVSMWEPGVVHHPDSQSRTGLGLSIVRDLITGAEGSVQSLGSPLGGLRVELRLPAVTGASVA